MKIPDKVPTIGEAIGNLPPDRVPIIFQHATTPLPYGRYLHWHDLKYRTPPDGLTREEWWAAILLARASGLQRLPLLDKQGNSFQFSTPSPVLIDLHRIDREAAGQLHSMAGSAMEVDKNSQRYLLSSLIEEAITSSQLEGASTTRQVAAAMLQTGRKPRNHSETMIFNNYRTMEYLRSLKKENLTPNLVLELHRMLTQDTLENPEDAGRLRQDNEIHIMHPGTETTLHIPSDYKELPERLERLCKFANMDETDSPFVHPVLRAILLHFMIGYDHPFVDGNGRTARALFYWSLARSGYWLMEYTSISHFLRKAPAQYMKAYLYTETDGNDTTYFLLHQLRTIRRSITALHEYIDRTLREQKETQQLLAASPKLRTAFNHRQVSLLTHALKHPQASYRVDAHQRSHNVVYQTARSDLLQLHELGLLEKGKQGNAYVFFVPEDLRERLSVLA
ncbi:MAG: Fic family protein [Zoogloeaceae bacterium]|jgi:Fic family protein|nr:Fic family protein [Zoogloeaceae bacterium]